MKIPQPREGYEQRWVHINHLPSSEGWDVRVDDDGEPHVLMGTLVLVERKLPATWTDIGGTRHSYFGKKIEESYSREALTIVRLINKRVGEIHENLYGIPGSIRQIMDEGATGKQTFWIWASQVVIGMLVIVDLVHRW